MLEEEALKALNSGELAKSLITGISWAWLWIAIGIPIFGMIVYKFVITGLANRLILFITNKPWTDKGKLIEYKGERWVIEKLGVFRVYLSKSVLVKNRGKEEKMKKTLTITITRYLDSDIVYYEYQDLYNEESIEEIENKSKWTKS